MVMVTGISKDPELEDPEKHSLGFWARDFLDFRGHKHYLKKIYFSVMGFLLDSFTGRPIGPVTGASTHRKTVKHEVGGRGWPWHVLFTPP